MAAAAEADVSDKDLESIIREKLAKRNDAAPFEVPSATAEAEGARGIVAEAPKKRTNYGTEVAPVRKKKKTPAQSLMQKEEAEIQALMQNPGDSSKTKAIVKRTLDEILKSASDDDDRPSALARRDVYAEVGITSQEVEAYWDRRTEAVSNFFEKASFWGLIFAAVVFFLIVGSVVESIVHPPDQGPPVIASMIGTD